MKNPGKAGVFNARLLVSVVAASEYGDQVKQVDKEVKKFSINLLSPEYSLSLRHL